MAARGGSGRARLALEAGPLCPLNHAWIWDQYCDLARLREQGFAGASLTWPALEAWMRIRRLDLAQRDIDLLIDLETAEPKEFNADG